MAESTEPIPPIVCNLSIGRREAQGLEWHDLAKHAATTEHIDSGVMLSFALAVASQVEDLAQREMNCCGSWLTITTKRSADTIRLKVTTKSAVGLQMIVDTVGTSVS